MTADLLKALAAKGGLVGIHGAAGAIGKRYSEWARGSAWARNRCVRRSNSIISGVGITDR